MANLNAVQYPDLYKNSKIGNFTNTLYSDYDPNLTPAVRAPAAPQTQVQAPQAQAPTGNNPVAGQVLSGIGAGVGAVGAGLQSVMNSVARNKAFDLENQQYAQNNENFQENQNLKDKIFESRLQNSNLDFINQLAQQRADRQVKEAQTYSQNDRASKNLKSKSVQALSNTLLNSLKK